VEGGVECDDEEILIIHADTLVDAHALVTHRAVASDESERRIGCTKSFDI
jgi:hypothetical protein